MPPPRIATLAREPHVSLPPRVAKSQGGYGATYGGVGFGNWGYLPGSTGSSITPLGALQLPVAYACVKRLSEDMGKLPRLIRRAQADGGAAVVRDHPLRRLLRNPNPWMTASQLWSFMTGWLALRGNAYAVVLRGNAGEPRAIVPVLPDNVAVAINQETGEVYYTVSHPYLGATRRFHRDNVLHMRNGISADGYTGISPIAASQDGFGIGIAAQQHGAVLFRQGAQLNGVIKHPGRLSNDAKNNLSNNFDARHAGVQNAHKTAVLDEGMSFEKVGMTMEDAQFLGTREFTVPEICRMFGVPPHKVQDLSHAHFNNLEQSELAYRSDTLLPIGTQFKEECGRVLLFDDEQDELEIDVDYDELLRADKLTRYQTYQIGLNNGIINRNEARIDDGRSSVEGGDDFRVPLNTGAPTDPPDPALGASNQSLPGQGKF